MKKAKKLKLVRKLTHEISPDKLCENCKKPKRAKTSDPKCLSRFWYGTKELTGKLFELQKAEIREMRRETFCNAVTCEKARQTYEEKKAKAEMIVPNKPKKQGIKVLRHARRNRNNPNNPNYTKSLTSAKTAVDLLVEIETEGYPLESYDETFDWYEIDRQ